MAKKIIFVHSDRKFQKGDTILYESHSIFIEKILTNDEAHYDKWRVHDKDLINELKAEEAKAAIRIPRYYIYSKYSYDELFDHMKQDFYSTVILKAAGVQNLEARVMEACNEIKEGTNDDIIFSSVIATFDKEVSWNEIPGSSKDERAANVYRMFSDIVKTILRFEWMKECYKYYNDILAAEKVSLASVDYSELPQYPEMLYTGNEEYTWDKTGPR